DGWRHHPFLSALVSSQSSSSCRWLGGVRFTWGEESFSFAFVSKGISGVFHLALLSFGKLVLFLFVFHIVENCRKRLALTKRNHKMSPNVPWVMNKSMLKLGTGNIILDPNHPP